MEDRKVIKIIIALILVAILVVGGVLIGKYKEDEDGSIGGGKTSCNKYYRERTENGERYKLNSYVSTFLIMGIDKTEDEKMFYQSDFVSLIVFNKETKKYDVIQLNRDTMTSICYYSDTFGEHIKDEVAQLALSFSYGGTTNYNRAKNTVRATENLLKMNVSQYVAMDMDAVKSIVEFANGITLTVPCDMTAIDPSFIENAEITFNKQNSDLAIKFLRARTELGEEDNASRMQRHKLFYEATIKALSEKSFSDSEALDLYDSLDNRLTTNVDRTEFLDLFKMLSNEYTYNQNYIPSGSYNSEAVRYAEFNVDQTALDEFILGNYYKKS